MDNTSFEIPTELLQAAQITPKQARTELAIRLYQTHKLNEKQATELAEDPTAIATLAWNNRTTGRFELDDFLEWASHDLKTPLNAMIGFTKVVLKGIDGPLNETQTADLTTAFNGGQRMLALIGQLVEIARLNNGHILLNRETRDLAELLLENAERWKNQNPAKPLTLDLRVASPIFQVDVLQMRQITMHLLTLAALRITEGTVDLSAREDDQSLHVTIQSTGRKAADKMEMDSAMLGFIAASLIKLHGGTMEQPQETEAGVSLRFSLPKNT